MAGSTQANPPKVRKRVEVETNSLKRARDGSAFAKCEDCNKDVPVVLIDMHSCSLEAKIKMNLEAHVVETEVQKKPVEKRKPKSSDSSAKNSKSEGKAKDPNMPKRPLSAFFVFLADFRKEFNEANPDIKKGSAVAKEGGDKWKSMTDEEKKPFQDRAVELKAEYETAMENYNAGNADGNEESAEKEGEDEETLEKEVKNEETPEKEVEDVQEVSEE